MVKYRHLARRFAWMVALLAPLIPANLAWAFSVSNPTHNVSPTYYDACYIEGSQSKACGTAILNQMNTVNKSEGAEKVVLPPDYYQLTPAEQVFVITNLNRLAFGLPAIPAMNADANAYALGNTSSGALGNTDPSVPGALSTGQSVVAWDGNWAEDINVLSSDFNWMYNDGLGSFNIDCTTTKTSGCWGHRDNILENWDTLLTNAGWTSINLAAGAAEVAINGMESITYDAIATTTPAPPSFTWDTILASYAAAGLEPVVPFTTSRPTLTSGALVRISGSSELYWVSGGTLHPILSDAIQTGIFGVTDTPVTTLSAPITYPIGEPAVAPFRSGMLMQAFGQKPVYLVMNGVLHHVANPQTLAALGFQFNQVTHVPTLPDFWPIGTEVTLNSIPTYNGELLRFQGTAPVYLDWKGALHHIQSPAEFSALGFHWSWVANLPNALGNTPVGSPVVLPGSWFSDGTLIQVRNQNPVYLVANGQLHHIASLAAFRGLQAIWGQVLKVSHLPSLSMGTPIS